MRRRRSPSRCSSTRSLPSTFALGRHSPTGFESDAVEGNEETAAEEDEPTWMRDHADLRVPRAGAKLVMSRQVRVERQPKQENDSARESEEPSPDPMVRGATGLRRSSSPEQCEQACEGHCPDDRHHLLDWAHAHSVTRFASPCRGFWPALSAAQRSLAHGSIASPTVHGHGCCLLWRGQLPGSYRRAAAICGATQKTVKRVMDANEAASAGPC